MTRHEAPGGREPGRGAAVLDPRRFAAWRLLPDDLRGDLDLLRCYVTELRAISDHPAMAGDRKEARFKHVADALGGTALVPVSSYGASGDPAAVAAAALSARLAELGIDGHRAWQSLQAAGQDLRKFRYRGWSDLLTWCRFAGGAPAALALLMAGGRDVDIRAAEAWGIAIQLLSVVRDAGNHYRWLGRVYLPERWFSEAGAQISQLGAMPVGPELRAVFTMALDQAERLLDDSAGLAMTFPSRRLRIAVATAHAECRALARAWRRADPLSGLPPLSRPARLRARLGGLMQGSRRG